MKELDMKFRQIAGVLFVASMLVLGGCGDDESSGDDSCQLVCEKSEQCGGAPANCMESCASSPPSGACLACYEEDSCADVGRCLVSCAD
jgi:hypothetical protein